MTEPTTTEGTEYLVLMFKTSSDDSAGTWVELGTIITRDATSAIKAKAGPAAHVADTHGVFVAVPARSWKPTKVSSKVATTLVLEDAS